MQALTSVHGVQLDVLTRVVHEHWSMWLAEAPAHAPLVHSLLGATADTNTGTAVEVVPEMSSDRVLRPTVRQLQHVFVAAQNESDHVRCQAQLAAIADQHERQECQTRHLSQSGMGAMAFAACLPSVDEAFTMSSPLLRESYRRHLGIERPTTPDSLCPVCPSTNTPQHARRCAKTGLLTARHNIICRCTQNGLRQLGLTGLRAEDYAPFAVGPKPRLHIDITIPGGQGLTLVHGPAAATSAAKSIMLDISITDPTADRLLPRAHLEQGYAAELRARDKHVTYNAEVYPAERYTLVPMAIETFGTTCKEMQKFLDSLASYKCQQTAGTWRKSAVLDWWRRRLSVAVQSAISFAVDASLSRSRPRGDTGAYTRVHLLRQVAEPVTGVGTRTDSKTDAGSGALPHCT